MANNKPTKTLLLEKIREESELIAESANKLTFLGQEVTGDSTTANMPRSSSAMWSNLVQIYITG